MYCVKCGVELADSEKKCPLCGTVVFHPDLGTNDGPGPYPPKIGPEEKFSPSGILFVISVLMLLGALITLICDIELNRRVIWSGYSVFGLILFYVVFVLPFWFKKPNPIIFVPVDFACVILFLLYVDLKLGGRWFLSFAFPVTGGAGLIVTAAVTLARTLGRGRLFITGGTLIVTGAFCLLAEFLADITFIGAVNFNWCFYPLTALCLMGSAILVIALVPPLRESLRKKLFI
ncbi:MAG: zinc ribbon domain-containing protein [Clostridia bacterium]|nr:zinc ribbon domain-containing protein [Clostridia bacterium]